MVPVGLLLLAASPPPAPRWTDNTGKFPVEAELVEFKGHKVRASEREGTKPWSHDSIAFSSR